MAPIRFKLPIGAKRQVTIPRQCMEMLSLEEGGELLLEIDGDHAALYPVVSVPRRELPEGLRRKFDSPRGQTPVQIPSGVSLSGFPTDIGYSERTGTRTQHMIPKGVQEPDLESERRPKPGESAAAIVFEPEVGKAYPGKVVRVMTFGAFVELSPGIDGLIPVSEIAEHRVRDARDELREGDEILVKITGIESDRIELSRKAVLPKKLIKATQSASAEAEPTQVPR